MILSDVLVQKGILSDDLVRWKDPLWFTLRGKILSDVFVQGGILSDVLVQGNDPLWCTLRGRILSHALER